MTSWQVNLYNKSPWALKEALVALEAWRRNRYRRYGDYHSIRGKYDLREYEKLSHDQIRVIQLEKLQELVTHARQKTEFYRGRLPERITDLSELQALPIVTKEDLRYRIKEMIEHGYPAKHLFKAYTSGSTGTPVLLFVGREGIRARQAILDNYYELFGCSYGQKRVRMGGSRIKPASSTTPPFWIMNRVDNQLQLSPYHLDEVSFPAYRDELNSFEPAYLSGYGHAFYNLATHILQDRELDFVPKTIFLDSEGVPPQFITTIEQAFHCPAFQNYGLGEAGLIAVQIASREMHLLELSCIVEIVDEYDRAVPDGTMGRIIITDLTQKAVPYIRYDTGDVGTISPENSNEKLWHSKVLECIDGRRDEIIVTPKGRRIGRLSHVTKPGRGILESQIAHISPTEVEIRIVPASDFDEESMKDVLAVACDLLGDEMTVTWRISDAIPRTSNHKFRHVVREF